MAKYLVTGIAGFIGSSIARALVAQGEEVRGIDNFSSGKRENIEEIYSEIEFVEGDILDRDLVREVCRNVDFIFHEAAIPSVPRSVADPIESNSVNVDATLNVLTAANEAGAKRIVFASSCALYGDPQTLPVDEGMLPDPVSPYAVAKLCAENYMRSFYRVYGLETVSLRYFNVFGPHQDASSAYSGVLAKFITQMVGGEQPVIFGDGAQSRDFVFIDNVVQANLLACKAPAGKVAGRMFNIASGKRFSLNQTFAALKELTRYKGQAKYEEERTGDIRHSLADISLAKECLGYKPVVDFYTGLSRTIAWYKQSMALPCIERPGLQRLIHARC